LALDIHTKKGQKSLADERRAMGAFSSAYGVGWVETPKDKPAWADGLLVKGDEVRGVGEVKCRYNLTLSKFKNAFNMEWLVTASKVDECKTLAVGLQVPFVGFMFLVDEGESGMLLWKRIDQLKVNTAITKTQATINGGTTHRLNAFIPMKHCKGLRL
jgi:hypothetical protein